MNILLKKRQEGDARSEYEENLFQKWYESLAITSDDKRRSECETYFLYRKDIKTYKLPNEQKIASVKSNHCCSRCGDAIFVCA